MKTKYIAIYASAESAPHVTWRISTSKGWCQRHINSEDYRAECAKDFSSKFRLICELEGLRRYMETSICTSYPMRIAKKKILEIIDELEEL